MTPNRRGPSAKTAPKLDAMYQHICTRFQPPYYEMPTTREIAAEFGIVQPEACRYLKYLEQDGRLIRSPAGKLVPVSTSEIIMYAEAKALGFTHLEAVPGRGIRIRVSVPELLLKDVPNMAEAPILKTIMTANVLESIEKGSGREWLTTEYSLHTVRAGESWSSIAIHHYGAERLFHDLMKATPEIKALIENWPIRIPHNPRKFTPPTDDIVARTYTDDVITAHKTRYPWLY